MHIAFSIDDIINEGKFLELSDDESIDTVESLLADMVVKIKYENNSYETLENEAKEAGHFDYSYALKDKGTYTLSITIKDKAGNTTTKTKEFEVGAEKESSANQSEVMGGVLIGLSVALLVGVIGYFVINKKKLDKKEKSYRRDARRK